MENSINIFLVGPMGAGKTTVGKVLAKRLGLIFLDLDDEIEKLTGADISWIFDIEGEDGFRERESQILKNLTSKTGVLIATGGGSVLRKENRSYLVQRGTVVYLEISAKQQVQRIAHSKNRPILEKAIKSGYKPYEFLSNLSKKREPLYKEIADITFQVDKDSSHILVTKIAKYFDDKRNKLFK